MERPRTRDYRRAACHTHTHTLYPGCLLIGGLPALLAISPGRCLRILLFSSSSRLLSSTRSPQATEVLCPPLVPSLRQARHSWKYRAQPAATRIVQTCPWSVCGLSMAWPLSTREQKGIANPGDDLAGFPNATSLANPWPWDTMSLHPLSCYSSPDVSYRDTGREYRACADLWCPQLRRRGTLRTHGSRTTLYIR